MTDLYARALKVLSGMAPTRAELADVLGLTMPDADRPLGDLVRNHHVWPANKGGTFVWELTAAGRVVVEAATT